MKPAPACDAHPLADGVLALPGGFALLTHSRVLICADAHLGYEDVMGGGAALPLWSTTEIVASIALAARRHDAREIVFLGDAIHGAGLSEGAGRAVGAALDALRAQARVTIVAGNHEGRTRGVAVLGATVESCERDGWTLAHGDRPESRPSTIAGYGAERTIIGHLHPSLHLGGEITAPAFLASRALVVVPALTPYSPGLDVTGDACLDALAAWGVGRRDLHVVAATAERVFPFGTLSALRGALYLHPGDGAAPLGRRRRLRSDR
ncbi:MAG: putative phosphoesterase [Candidatus Eremiobacteraeota bacterium]|nr:putative phosphoesterase [Candidatus Eremiobacteraeota bacterium]